MTVSYNDKHKKKQREQLKKFLKENTKEVFSHPWCEIEEHLNNLIEYYSYLASNCKENQRAYQQRSVKLILAKEMLYTYAKNQSNNPESLMINLTNADLMFLEYHLKDDIANKIKDKTLINTEEFVECPGLNYIRNNTKASNNEQK